MTLKTFIEKLNIVRPEEISICLDEEKNVLFLRYKNTLYQEVVPERPFPISYPEFVILKDSKGDDICSIKDIRKLDDKSRASLEKLLDTLYFIPKILKIIRLEATGDRFEWETETERGKRSFTTRGRRSILFLGNKMVITDTDDNLYQVEDIGALDEKSRKIIQSTF